MVATWRRCRVACGLAWLVKAAATSSSPGSSVTDSSTQCAAVITCRGSRIVPPQKISFCSVVAEEKTSATWEGTTPVPSGSITSVAGPAAPAIHELTASAATQDPAKHRNAAMASNLMAGDHLVDEPVLDGLVGLEEAIALHVAMHVLDRLAGVLGVDLVDAHARLEDLPGVDLDVRRLALEAR